MLSDFTPGPWFINEGRKYYDELHRICKDSNGMIATVVSIEDAHLIAAAPELLAALRECVAWFEDNCVDCYALDDAREALKKAEGK